MILIFGSYDDPHIEIVKHYLNEYEIKTVHIGESDNAIITASVSNKKDKIYALVNDQIYDMSCIKTVWWRAKPLIRFYKNNLFKESVINFQYDEWLAFAKGLYGYVPEYLWINNIKNIYISNIKMLQLRVAKKIGFNIPETRITNNANEVNELINEYKEIIYKPLHKRFFTSEKGLEKILYTALIDKETLPNLIDSIKMCPGIYQENIVKKYELRITVIENDFFAIKIESQKNPITKIDWRKSHNTNIYNIVDIPHNIKEMILKYMNYFGLKYGAFDFIFNKDNEYVFLECNPTGQWLWLEKMTQVKISQALAEKLLRMHENAN